MSDIGPGDVVERLTDHRYGLVKAGERFVVERIGTATGRCPACRDAACLHLRGVLPSPGRDGWSPCKWKKIGGSQADTIRTFAEDLSVKPPQKVTT